MATEVPFQHFSHTGLIVQAGEGGPAIIRRAFAKKDDAVRSIYQPTFWVRCPRHISTIPVLLEKIEKEEGSEQIHRAIWKDWQHSRSIGEIPLRHPENSRICATISLHVIMLSMSEADLIGGIRHSEHYDFIPVEPANLASLGDKFEIDGGEEPLLQTPDARKTIHELLGRAFPRAIHALSHKAE